MTITAIVIIIVVGLILLLLEILIIPGFIVGIIGLALMLTGIINAYFSHGISTGNYVLGGTALVSILSLYLSFRSATWKKATLDSTIDGKVNTLGENLIKAGDSGITVSRLAPIGTALINDIQVEVQSAEGFIDQEIPVTVVKIDAGKIIVKRKKA